MTTKPDRIPEPEPVHPGRRPARSDEHDPLSPPHPDHDLPGQPPPPDRAPQPPPTKSGRQTRDVTAPATTLTALLPSSAAIGDPSFTVRTIGTGFTADSVIVFAGQDEPTAFVSSEELTTGVNMSVWLGPDPAIPVLVRTLTEETAPLTFAFTPPREVPLPEAHASQPIPLMDQITRM